MLFLEGRHHTRWHARNWEQILSDKRICCYIYLGLFCLRTVKHKIWFLYTTYSLWLLLLDTLFQSFYLIFWYRCSLAPDYGPCFSVSKILTKFQAGCSLCSFSIPLLPQEARWWALYETFPKMETEGKPILLISLSFFTYFFQFWLFYCTVRKNILFLLVLVSLVVAYKGYPFKWPLCNTVVCIQYFHSNILTILHSF